MVSRRSRAERRVHAQRRKLTGRNKIVVMLAALVMAVTADGSKGAQPSWRAADEIDLIPTPRTLELGDQRYPLDQFEIVVDADGRLAKTAVKEINRRARFFGGSALPVRHSFAEAPTIFLGTDAEALPSSLVSKLTVSPSELPEQGYAIQSLRQGGHPYVVCLGNDAHGIVYAAMTVRRLIQNGDDGPYLREASVRDWPAFKRRSIGRFWTSHEPHAERYIRWLARHKVNMINIRGSWLYDRQGDSRKRVIDRIRQMTETAADYGMQARMIFQTDIKEIVSDAEWIGCVKRRDGERWFCWTAEKAHRKKARTIAHFLKDAGINFFTLHAADGGFYEDPETWSERCSRCRKAYGNDRGKAGAELFNLYRRVLKRIHPTCDYEIVAYPYHYQFAAKGFLTNPARFKAMPGPWHFETFQRLSRDRDYGETQVHRLKTHHRKLEKALPDEVVVTFREGGAKEFEGAARLWKEHPIDIWTYFYRTDGWRGMWEPQARLVKTWHRPRHRDMFFNAFIPFGYGPVRKWTLAAASAEYSWNTGLPDATASFTIDKRYYDEGVRTSTQYQRTSLIPRILHRFWGKPGMAFHRLLANNVSFYYVAKPNDMLGRGHHEKFADPYAYYSEQVEALKDAKGKADRLIERASRSVSHLRERRPVAYEYALIFYWMIHKAAAKGEIEMAFNRANSLAEQGKHDKAATRLKALLKRLPALQKDLSKMQKQVIDANALKLDPKDFSPRWSGHGLKSLNIDKEREAVKARLRELE